MGEASAARRVELPLLPAGPVQERADAARNRARSTAPNLRI